MKDPLQMTQTPFEVLNVKPNASVTEKRKALIEAIATGHVSANKAKRAFDELHRPLEQAKRLILQYPLDGLRRVIPNPMRDSSILSPARRAYTAEMWQQYLCDEFPDIQTIHCLAVLWYWWSLYEEHRMKTLVTAAPVYDIIKKDNFTKQDLIRTIRAAEGVECDPTNYSNCTHHNCPWLEDCRSSAPPLEEMWHKLIGYWSALAAAQEFWNKWPGVSDTEAGELRNTFINSLHQELVALSQYYGHIIKTGRNKGVKNELAELPGVGSSGAEALLSAGISSLSEVAWGGIRKLSDILNISLEKAQEILTYARGTILSSSSLSRRYRLLDLMLATEIETAEAMAKVGMRTNHGTVRCGVLMLHSLGLIEIVQAQVRNTLERYPNNKGLQKLCNALSQHFSITVLIANDKAAEALQIIEHLPANQSCSADVSQLKVQALDLLAEQQESLGHIEDAIISWATVLKYTGDTDVRQRTENKIITLCRSYTATAMHKAEFDRAVSVIEMALQIVGHRDLKLALGELLYQRAKNKYQCLQEGKNGLRRIILQPDIPDLRKILTDLRQAEELGVYSARKEADFVKKLIEQLEL